jgi:hypothetical protein
MPVLQLVGEIGRLKYIILLLFLSSCATTPKERVHRDMEKGVKYQLTQEVNML